MPIGCDRPSHTITQSPGDRIVVVRLKGFWDEADIDTFSMDLLATRQTMLSQAAAGEARILVDLREYPVQTKLVTERLEQLILQLADFPHAVLVPAQALNRMQMERIGQKMSNRRAFASEAEARAWLNT